MHVAPVGADDTASVIEYGAVAGNVLSGAGADYDGDGDTMTVAQVLAISGSFGPGAAVVGLFGTLTLLIDGSYSYVADHSETLAAGQSGLDVFTYTVSDDKGATDTATLSIIVSGTNNGTPGNDHLLGTAAAESFFGYAGDDTIDAGAGHDVLDGGAGSDVLIGGDGNDRFCLGSDNDAVIDTSGTDTITSTISRNLASYSGIENLTLLGSDHVNGTGNAINNVIIGNAGANALNGGTGNDTLIGGAGNDVLYGGPAGTH